MFETTSFYAPVSDEAISRMQPLTSHICVHEASIASEEYDPINSPRVMAPLLLKQLFDPQQFDDALFFDLFAGMAAEPERAINGSMRVYVDGMLSPRHENGVLFSVQGPHVEWISMHFSETTASLRSACTTT